MNILLQHIQNTEDFTELQLLVYRRLNARKIEHKACVMLDDDSVAAFGVVSIERNNTGACHRQ